MGFPGQAWRSAWQRVADCRSNGSLLVFLLVRIRGRGFCGCSCDCHRRWMCILGTWRGRTGLLATSAARVASIPDGIPSGLCRRRGDVGRPAHHSSHCCIMDFRTRTRQSHLREPGAGHRCVGRNAERWCACRPLGGKSPAARHMVPPPCLRSLVGDAMLQRSTAG